MGSSDRGRAIRVERIAPLGPAMRRVTFAPAGAAQPPEMRPHGGHCRLLFPDPLDAAAIRGRAFTYRRWHADGRFDIDFAVHEGNGPAAQWLRHAAPGDVLGWRHGGPPKVSLKDPGEGAAILIADATALPLVSALVEKACHSRPVHVLLLVFDAQTLPIAEGPAITVRRCDGPEAAEARLRRMDLRECSLFLAACEAGVMRRLRRLVLDELGLRREALFTSGYWKAGLTTEQVDAAKRAPSWFGDPDAAPGGKAEMKLRRG